MNLLKAKIYACYNFEVSNFANLKLKMKICEYIMVASLSTSAGFFP